MLSRILLALCLAIPLCLIPSRAEAKKGIPLIYNTGEEAFETGPLPAPFDKEPQLQGYKAGYLCEIKGVLWSYFSVSGCRPVAFQGDTYTDEPAIAAAVKAAYPESAMKKGVWGSYGWMILALVAVAGALLWVKNFFTGEDDEASPAET